MTSSEIKIKTFDDYTPTVIDDNKEVPNSYFPDYSYWAHDDRNSLVDPHTIVIHSMCVSAAVHPSGKDSTDAYDCKNLLESLGVSAHYLIPESEIEVNDSGKEQLVVYQMVQDDRKAGHAGPSRLPNLKDGEEPLGLNHTALGVELLNNHDGEFTDQQYIALVGLIGQLLSNGYPIENILGHYEVAGDDVRGEGKGKTDPEGFAWDRFLRMLAAAQGVEVSEVSHFRSRVS